MLTIVQHRAKKGAVEYDWTRAAYCSLANNLKLINLHGLSLGIGTAGLADTQLLCITAT